EKLRRLGKEHVYILELEPGELHEEEGALRLAAAVSGENLSIQPPNEGSAVILAEKNGILKVDVDRLQKINGIDGLGIATQHTNRLVKAGEKVAVAKVFPLVVEEEKLIQVTQIRRNGGPIISVIPLEERRVGLIITGNEVYHGLIKDEFGPVMKKKIQRLGSTVSRIAYVPDEPDKIVDEITKMKTENLDLIIATGGMAVDPDDVTLRSALQAKANVEKYGAPVQPGFMFMLSYLGKTPLLGIPACAMYYDTTILDLVLPRILAGEHITRKDIVSLGHGGLCFKCDTCRYPTCPFGRG
ncbi:molybdopterin-binding protein, partial [Candidatus Bathyarchaeota archaeon]|nr:molybdopterin-binding protein [Candidatus Bathyarchaeota archaeon]